MILCPAPIHTTHVILKSGVSRKVLTCSSWSSCSCREGGRPVAILATHVGSWRRSWTYHVGYLASLNCFYCLSCSRGLSCLSLAFFLYRFLFLHTHTVLFFLVKFSRVAKHPRHSSLFAQDGVDSHRHANVRPVCILNHSRSLFKDYSARNLRMV